MSERRVIIGNLDAEVDFARAQRREREERDERDEPRLDLPPAVLDHISAAATLLRVFATDTDLLWTPRPVDGSRLPVVPGLGNPELRCGALDDLPPTDRLLAWAETAAVERARERIAEPDGPAGLLDLVTDPRAAMAVNDRVFCLDAATRIGCALPGARLIEDVAALEHHLAAAGAAASPERRWVAKARFSAAGRSRLIGRGDRLDDLERRRTEKLLEVHGSLVFEPWMDRVADHGCCALIDDDGSHLHEPHRVDVDREGRFTGLTLPPTKPPGSEGDAPPSVRVTLRHVVERVAAMAHTAGYRGPLEIDCWEYRRAGGEIDFHPLGEINARMSFGHVAHALRDVLGREDSRLQLRFGDPRTSDTPITLLEPDARGRGGAWVELSS